MFDAYKCDKCKNCIYGQYSKEKNEHTCAIELISDLECSQLYEEYRHISSKDNV